MSDYRTQMSDDQLPSTVTEGILTIENQSLARLLAEERGKSRALEAELKIALAKVGELDLKLRASNEYGRYIHDAKFSEITVQYEERRLINHLFGEPGAYHNEVYLVSALDHATKLMQAVSRLQSEFESIGKQRTDEFEKHSKLTTSRGDNIPLATAESIAEWAKTRHAAIDSFAVQLSSEV